MHNAVLRARVDTEWHRGKGYELGETMVGIVVRSRLVETKGGIVGRSGLVDTIEGMVRHSVRGETLGASWGDPGAWARAI